MSVVAKRIMEARTAAGVSQEKLGVLAGIDEASASARMNQYERGKHTPDLTMVNRLAVALDVPAPYFYADDDALAHLLVTYHRLKKTDKKKAVEFVNGLSSR